MEQYCGAIAVDVWIQQVGGGTNFRRKRFLTLIERIQRGEIERVLIAHKDRLVRFGFDLLDDLSREHGCEIVVVNQESLSPQQEMAEDLLAIVHTFSCRLYGLRKYRKQIREDFPGSREPKEILQ
jgi:predicted site-specific integrase-resolvase